MTAEQASATLARLGAFFVQTKDGVDWWKDSQGNWVAKRALPGGYVDLRRLPAGSCGC